MRGHYSNCVSLQYWWLTGLDLLSDDPLQNLNDDCSSLSSLLLSVVQLDHDWWREEAVIYPLVQDMEGRVASVPTIGIPTRRTEG